MPKEETDMKHMNKVNTAVRVMLEESFGFWAHGEMDVEDRDRIVHNAAQALDRQSAFKISPDWLEANTGMDEEEQFLVAVSRKARARFVEQEA